MDNQKTIIRHGCLEIQKPSYSGEIQPHICQALVWTTVYHRHAPASHPAVNHMGQKAPQPCCHSEQWGYLSLLVWTKNNFLPMWMFAISTTPMNSKIVLKEPHTQPGQRTWKGYYPAGRACMMGLSPVLYVNNSWLCHQNTQLPPDYAMWYSIGSVWIPSRSTQHFSQ